MDDKTRILLKFIIPQRRKTHPNHIIPDVDKNLAGKTVVLTGGTDGIGRTAVEMFYECGAHVVVLGRNEAKGQEVIDQLSASSGQGSVVFELCDLGSMPSIQAAAQRILAQNDKIDILVNCAGVNSTQRAVTEEGFEMNWAVNYLGPFLLTRLLLERIKESGSARIVNLVTNLLFLDEIDFDDLQSEKKYVGVNAYTQAKIAMGMFTKELSQQLKGSEITANYLNPGFITSNLLREMKGPMKLMVYLNRMLASPSTVGADRILRLAISSAYEGVTGTYVSEDDIQPPHGEVRDASKRARLMKISEEAVSQWL